jgi:hypothetical protein
VNISASELCASRIARCERSVEMVQYVVVPVHPQPLPMNGLYAPQAWSGYYPPPPVVPGPLLGMSMGPVIPPVVPSTPSPTMSPVIPEPSWIPRAVVSQEASTPLPSVSPVIPETPWIPRATLPYVSQTYFKLFTSKMFI